MSSVPQRLLALLDKYMKAQVEIYRFNGNVLVARGGNVVYQKSFGYSNYDTKERLNQNALFDTGSIAKEFTAMDIVILKEKGKLSLDDSLQKFFPQLPYPKITIRHLLTHTSGIPEYFDLMLKKWDLQKTANNSDVINILASEKPAAYFDAGADLKYSSTAFDLLASIIEKVSGQSWTAFTTEQILKPLGMTYSRADNVRPPSPKPIPGVVYGFAYSDSLRGYMLAESRPENKGMHAFDDVYGSGGINASTGDLLKWDRALKNHTLISESAQKEMLSIQSTKNTEPPITFGYGIGLGRSDLGNYIYHSGNWPGFRAMLIRYLEDDVTVVVLSNNESKSEHIAGGLAAIALGRQVVMPSVHKEVPVDASELAQYAGRYMMTKLKQYYLITWPTAIIIRDNRLFLHLEGSPDQEDIELKAESPTKLFYADGTDRQLEFERDAAGVPVKMWQITWGVRREVKKI